MGSRLSPGKDSALSLAACEIHASAGTPAGDINPEFYAQKPWCPPQTYPQDYWAAIAMFANPLLWFAPSTVKPEDRAGIRAVMEIHKTHRDAIFAGEIHPVGQEPDGKAFTGLLSHNAETGKAYLILYREAGAEAEKAELLLPQTRASQWKRIAGSAKGTFRDCKRSSKLRIRHPDFCLSPLQKEPVSKRNRLLSENNQK